jgi:uncharacterized protein with HEPN domain
MAERIHQHFLNDMLDAVRAAREFTSGVEFEAFCRNREKQFAVVRAFEVLGEAAKNIPATVRARHAHLPWREMTGMRDKVIHGYFGVNLEIVWRTVAEEFPKLERGLIAIIEAEFRLEPPE